MVFNGIINIPYPPARDRNTRTLRIGDSHIYVLRCGITGKK